MSEFSYHNIFETKGIEYIITIFFFLFLIPFWMLLNRKSTKVQPVVEMAVKFNPSFSNAPMGLFYGKNHTWTFLERTGMAKIGLDELLIHLTGNVNIRLLKKSGDLLKKGDLFSEIEKDGKTLQIFSPITGRVMSLNHQLESQPMLLKNDPYGMGWLFEIEPENWLAETQTYYMADKATYWLKNEWSRIKDFVILSDQNQNTETAQLVMQDGGELVNNTLSEMPDEIWKNFQSEFLNRT